VEKVHTGRTNDTISGEKYMAPKDLAHHMDKAEELRKPILPGRGASDYERYLRTDELLALQKSTAELRHPDEMTFNMELEYPISMLHVLETITPYDYHIIRGGLGHGSGLDSPGFLALLHIGPRLGRAFDLQLEKAGLSAINLYRRHAEFFGLHDVAERMLDFDERMHLFRFHHLKLAQRIIGGGMIGTMGTPVEVLHQRMEHLFYKELWDVRNQITAGTIESV